MSVHGDDLKNDVEQLTLDEVDKMNIKELSDELIKRNQVITGSKAVLKHRLMSMVEKENEKPESEHESDKESVGIEGSDAGSFSHDGVGSEFCSNKNIKHSYISFRDIEDSLECYTGDGVITIEQWLKELEEINKITKWSDSELLICAKRLLKGSAKMFIRSQSNIISWRRFKEVITKEFHIRINSRDVHNQLQQRKKKTNETWREYMYEMMEIGKQINLELEVLIGYIVDGIEDESNDKLVLRGARSMEDLKYKFEEYERIKNAKVSRDKQKRFKIENAKPTTEKRMSATAAIRRCYNCGYKGHEAQNCPDVKKGPRCFTCQEFGHLSKNCSKPKTNINHIVKNIERCVEVELVGHSFDALVDTGSQVNLMGHDVPQTTGRQCVNSKEKTFTGFGGAAIKSDSVWTGYISIQGEQYHTTFHIVPNCCMSVPIILGNDLLQQAEVLFKPDQIVFKKLAQDEEPTENVPMWNIDVCDEDCDIEVPKVYRQEIQDIIQNYSPKKIKTSPIQTKIVLSDETPIYQKPRRLAPLERSILEKQIDEWLNDGVIRPSQSDFSSPVVIVRKKSGEYRVCIDYRRLNRNIIKDRYPMPFIDDQLDKLSGAKVFSIVDLKNGFLHVPVSEESIKYTAFSTPNNQYEFLKTPFGLCNSPASFGRFIYDIFKDLIKEGVVIQYVDDLIIPSVNEKEGIIKLRRVLQLASEYGLHIQWKKCSFLQTTVEYLGHIVENSQIKPSPNKVKAVMMFPKPTNMKQVQSFLGLSGYFRKFISGYSYIAFPLTRLLKKDVEFKFGPDEEKAFLTLKKVLSEEPVLRIYDPTALLEVHTDACQDGLGAVLLQKEHHEENFHPIMYMSKTTSVHEKKYHSYELEVLAVITAVKKFRPYLLGTKFKIVTDCAAFTRTVNKADIPNRVARWTLTLEEYDYVMEHRPAQRLRHVDALSRNAVMVVTDTFTGLIVENQNRDDRIAAIKKILETQEYDGYSLQNGVLLKYVEGKNVVVVPSNLERELIRRVHENGHFGVKKMHEIIKRDYYFSNMSKKLENQKHCCVACILAERKRGKMEGKLHPIPKDDAPLITYHVDHLGPMTATGKGYRYVLVIIDGFSKFTWIYPTKTTNAKEVLDRLELQSKTFGNPSRIISDRGAAFTSIEFQEYCKDREIEHLRITTGVPRGNGQVERQNQVIIAVLSKMSSDDPEKWYRYVDRVQRCLNSTYHRSIRTSPHEALVGVKLKDKLDMTIMDVLEKEKVEAFNMSREVLRNAACENIAKVQEQQKLSHDRKRKEATVYQVGDAVAIKRTQFGTGLKLRGKFLGPYIVTKVKRNERYDVKKVGYGEGPSVTSTSADLMKPWMPASSESDDL